MDGAIGVIAWVYLGIGFVGLGLLLVIAAAILGDAPDTTDHSGWVRNLRPVDGNDFCIDPFTDTADK